MGKWFCSGIGLSPWIQRDCPSWLLFSRPWKRPVHWLPLLGGVIMSSSEYESLDEEDVASPETLTNSPPKIQEEVTSLLLKRFPTTAPKAAKCHLCEKYAGHKCSTDGCFGRLCSICNFSYGGSDENVYTCIWCVPIMAERYDSWSNTVENESAA